MGEFSKAWDSSKSFRILVVSGIALVIVLMIAAGQNDSTPTPPAPVVANPNAPDPYADTADNRAHYAATIDQSMLDSGIESTTTATGPKKTTLRIKYALTGRVAANTLSKKLDFNELHLRGFRKVVLTNGFDGELGQTFTWKVD
jgi:hypothetical protein